MGHNPAVFGMHEPWGRVVGSSGSESITISVTPQRNAEHNCEGYGPTDVGCTDPAYQEQ